MKVLRIEDVISTVGLSKVTIWRMERDNEFPKRKRISPGCVGWLSSEIEEWIGSRPTVGKIGECDE